VSGKNKRYRKSWRVEETSAAPSQHDPPGAEGSLRPNRRGFLEASGFALFASAVAGCSRDEARIAPAPPSRSSTLAPGKSSYYASVCHGCSAACGILVKNRDGRPIKFEGNPAHLLSRGGLCPVGQATVLELFDSIRFRFRMGVF
jgi:molybdopterin-containing oxidoreductase family iron-sulfur binding subunit